MTGQQCFRGTVVAQDYQQKLFRFYEDQGPAPVEEVLWIMALSLEEQEELWAAQNELNLFAS